MKPEEATTQPADEGRLLSDGLGLVPEREIAQRIVYGMATKGRVRLEQGEIVAVARALLATTQAMAAMHSLAEHLRHCRECGETDVANCHEGEALWDSVMPQPAAEIGGA